MYQHSRRHHRGCVAHAQCLAVWPAGWLTRNSPEEDLRCLGSTLCQEDTALAGLQVNRVSEVVTGLADPSANIIFGAVIDSAYEGEVHVTIIATGFTQSFEENLLSGKVVVRCLCPGLLPDTSYALEGSSSFRHMCCHSRACIWCRTWPLRPEH